MLRRFHLLLPAALLVSACQSTPADKEPAAAPVAPDSAGAPPLPVDTMPGVVAGGVVAPEPVAPKAAVLKLKARTKTDSSFELPRISLPDPAVADRINQAIMAAAFEGEEADWTRLPMPQALEAAAGAYQREGHGLSGLSYDVRLNAHYLLSLDINTEGLGAYLSSSTRHLNFDLRTGRPLRLTDLIRPADTTALRRRLRVSISHSAAEALRTVATDFPEEPELPTQMPAMLHWNAATRQVDFGPNEPRLSEFTLTDQSLIFYYSFGFPHVIQAAEPGGHYPVTYAALRPMLRPGGPLAPLTK